MKLVNNSSLVLCFCWLETVVFAEADKSRVEVLRDAYRNEIQVPKPEVVTIVALSCRGVDANVRECKSIAFHFFLPAFDC